MPNYCSNELYISGSAENVNTVLDYVGMTRQEPQFDFATIIPYPDPYKQMDDDSWCIASWGTKWNAGKPSVELAKQFRLCELF